VDKAGLAHGQAHHGAAFPQLDHPVFRDGYLGPRFSSKPFGPFPGLRFMAGFAGVGPTRQQSAGLVPKTAGIIQ